MAFLAFGTADAGAATCTFAAPTVTVTLNAGETATVGTSAGVITLNNVNCTGNPTTAAAETINANGTTGNEILVVDLTNGPLGPGLTPEGAGTSEIEINANLGLSGADRVTITGGSANDHFVAGTTGINLNGDGDADVTFSGTELFTLTGSDGDDMLSAGGGSGTGSVLGLPTTFNGDNGTDTIKPGLGNDTIASGNGEDTLDASEAPAGVTINLGTTSAQSTGGLGTKTISGTENVIGSTANDVLDGDGSANDLIGGKRRRRAHRRRGRRPARRRPGQRHGRLLQHHFGGGGLSRALDSGHTFAGHRHAGRAGEPGRQLRLRHAGRRRRGQPAARPRRKRQPRRSRERRRHRGRVGHGHGQCDKRTGRGRG